MIQPPQEIEDSYKTPDPWGFTTSPEDADRKKRIMDSLAHVHPRRFARALDIGAGEGWITKDLPADEKHAFEISTQAKSRLPISVKGVDAPEGKYDLVVATGVLYLHYDCGTFFRLMREHSSSVILLCNIAPWEHPEIKSRWNELNFLAGKEVLTEEFPYKKIDGRLVNQRLRIFKIS